ncbi:MAG: PilN domain-containing protein [Pseudomonadota bacterium]
MTLMRRFFDWWGGELARVVPGPLRRAVWPRRPVIAAEPGPDGLHLTLRQGRAAPLGPLETLPARQRQRLTRAVRVNQAETVLALPADRVITRRVTLPLAAEPDLAAMLPFEIDRLTPFSAEEIYYAHRVIDRSPGTGKLEIDLIFIPRADLAGEECALAEAGLTPARIDLSLPSGGLAGLDLMPRREVARRSPGQTLAIGLGTVCALLALAFLVVKDRTLADTLEDRQRQLSQLRRAAIARSEALPRASATDLLAVAAYEAKKARPRAVDLLTDLTAALPDDTWLISLSLSQQELRINGTSADANALIGIFERHRRFSNPVFRAPVTLAPQDGRERFTISAEIAVPEAGQ